MNKKLLIFDLDGTIADTLYSIRDAVNMCMEHFGFEARSYEQVRAAVGDGAKKLLERSVPANIREDKARVDEVYKHFQKCYGITYNRINGCYAGMKETMLALRDRGYTLAVLSNKPDAYVKGIIKDLFDERTIPLAMGETELPRKPEPTVPLMICDRFEALTDESAFIGDSEVDVRTAKNAGMTSVAVSWGFRDRDVLERAGADVIIDTPEQLLDIFR